MGRIDRFRNKRNFSRQVIIHPNGCDPHSHAACPISVIYRLMRLEATLCHHTRFTLNVTSSDPSKITNLRLQLYITCQLKEVSFSASTLGTVGEINIRDRMEILCQTFVHTSCPGTGQTKGTIQYIHLRHCYLRLIQQPLHFTPSSIIFGIYDSQRLCQYRVVLWIIIQPVSPY